MYETLPPAGHTSETALLGYTEFLSDLGKFEDALNRVLTEWPVSCKQFLTNRSINRIAWLGQASMCIATGVPARFRAGFAALTPAGQTAANTMAESYLRKWEVTHKQTKHYYYPEDETTSPVGLQSRVAHYLKTWKWRDYLNGIPDEVPPELMRLNLAPSYKAIALAVLKNDHSLSSLGYNQPVSPWYSVLKRIEISNRQKSPMSDPMF
jgi:hypothetical protein